MPIAQTPSVTVAVNPDAGKADRKHHGGLVAPLAGKVGGHLGRTECLQCNVDHHRVQLEPPRPLFGLRRQPHGGPSRTGARDGEPDDPLESRTMLLTGASQPPIKVVRIQLSRWRLVDLRRLWSRLHAALQRRAGMYRPPGCAAAGTDLNAGFGFVAAQRCDDDRRIRDVHQLMQAKLTDHPRLVAVGAECLCHGRQREFGVRRPGQHARVVDAVITEPQKIRTECAFPHPGAVRWIRDADPEQGVPRHRSGRACRRSSGGCGARGWWGGRGWGSGGCVGVRRVGGVGGVEVGVEGQRVVGVALQGSDAVVMNARPGCR